MYEYSNHLKFTSKGEPFLLILYEPSGTVYNFSAFSAGVLTGVEAFRTKRFKEVVNSYTETEAQEVQHLNPAIQGPSRPSIFLRDPIVLDQSHVIAASKSLLIQYLAGCSDKGDR